MFTKATLIGLATILATLVFPGEGRADVVEDLNCLALNIYFEARSEPLDGKLAVGYVVLNRVADKRFPNKICEVVKQGGAKKRHRCQFSWWCDGRSDRPRDLQAWKESRVLARLVFWGYSEDPSNGALWYHAD
ncbi:MAG: cell wall hydrolase, partial [Alphaproteobacteria bacterium]|nr:cell wall hydrolase [Alphaproteobacteria bacterium]